MTTKLKKDLLRDNTKLKTELNKVRNDVIQLSEKLKKSHLSLRDSEKKVSELTEQVDCYDEVIATLERKNKAGKAKIKDRDTAIKVLIKALEDL